MKILYIDGAPPDALAESYGIKPTRYGGGGAPARFLKLKIPNFTIFAKKEAFNDYTYEDYAGHNHQNYTIREEVYTRLFNREPLKDVLANPIIDLTDIDLVMTGNRGLHINLAGLKAKYVSWATGGYETVSDTVDYLLTYNDFQHPQITNPKTKVGRIVIGKPIPNYKPERRDGFIFQCTAMRDCFSVQEVVDFCERNRINGVFAGPKGDDIKFGKYSDYLGEVSEGLKLQYLRRCRLTTLLHKAHTCFSLSAVEALSVGTPIACYNQLFWPEMIVHQRNGFFIDKNNFNQSLLEAYNNADKLDGFDIHLSSYRYSEEQMCFSFMSAFREIMEDIKKSK